MFEMFRRHGTATGALRDFYDVPRPAADTPLEQLPLLAVDIETTGLDPAKDRVLSIGWVPVNGGEIDLSGSGYELINTAGADSVGHSATIHGLTDEELSWGTRPDVAVDRLLRALAGRALLAHYAFIEREFLGALCREHYGSGLSVPVVDTFAIERRHMERMGTFPRGEDLRLSRVRARYELPEYRSHNALTDALACAELYLAMKARAQASTLKAMQPL